MLATKKENQSQSPTLLLLSRDLLRHLTNISLQNLTLIEAQQRQLVVGAAFGEAKTR